jgi:hypothetical protein
MKQNKEKKLKKRMKDGETKERRKIIPPQKKPTLNFCVAPTLFLPSP